MEETFIIEASVLKFNDLLGTRKLANKLKFQHNIINITCMAHSLKNTGVGFEYQYKCGQTVYYLVLSKVTVPIH